jgi:hypothetical protein
MDSATQYLKLISNPKTLEPALQTFLEQHSELIPTPFELGHHIRYDSFITKFPLDNSLITDFVYLTKDSGSWRVVLVEIERANIKLYTNDPIVATPTAQFTKRLAQIEKWQSFVQKNSEQLKAKLAPLMKWGRNNPIKYKYVLIVGRNSSLNNETKADNFYQKSNNHIKIITHDSIISWFKAGTSKRRNIMQLKAGHYTYKYLTCPCFHTFNTLTSSDLLLKEKHEKRLKRHGFEILKWKNGERLDPLGKAPTGSLSTNPVLVSNISKLHNRMHLDARDV